MTQQATSPHNTQIAQGLPKESSRHAAGKFSPTYWEPRVERPSYTKGNERVESAEYFVRIYYGGQRHWVALHSNHRQTAARAAARFYHTLRAKGWEAALASHSPDRALKPKAATVGEFLGAVEQFAALRPRTLAVYGYALRRIAADIAGNHHGPSRFDPTTKPWRRAADSIPLNRLTVDAIEKWKGRMLVAAGKNPIDRQQAKRNVNSYIRNARSLFRKKLVLKLNVELPDPLPFAGVELEEKPGGTKYHSTIDPSRLLAEARTDLAESDPDAWKAILLALGAGLRRSEIDNLCWTQIDVSKATISVRPLRHFVPKTEDSEGTVWVDPGMLRELEAARGDRPSLFVVDPATPVAETTGAQYYRCQATFERATRWLRGHGVTADKPLHELRKEFGSILASKAGIYVASRQLRHSQIKTTSDSYTDNRGAVAVPVGDMLNQPTRIS